MRPIQRKSLLSRVWLCARVRLPLRARPDSLDPMVSAIPGVQAGISDCLSLRHGIYSSRPKDLRADSPKVKPLRNPPLKEGGWGRNPQNPRGLRGIPAIHGREDVNCPREMFRPVPPWKEAIPGRV